MNLELTVDPADFNLLNEHHVLVVNGRSHPNHNRDSGVVLNVAPSDLLALVGKACETCGGDGRVIWRQAIGYETARTEPCPDCHGTGSELLTVKTECCERYGTDGHTWQSNHPEASRSLLVRLTGQPVPVVKGPWHPGKTNDAHRPAHIMVFSDGTARYWPDNWDLIWENGTQVDLGPDPASLIGRWVWLPDTLSIIKNQHI